MRVQADGIAFKSSGSGQIVQVKHSEIDVVEWLREKAVCSSLMDSRSR